MEATLCIIFSVLAVYGLYSALRECVRFIDRISSLKNSRICDHNPVCSVDHSSGCAGCGTSFKGKKSSDEDKTE